MEGEMRTVRRALCSIIASSLLSLLPAAAYASGENVDPPAILEIKTPGTICNTSEQIDRLARIYSYGEEGMKEAIQIINNEDHALSCGTGLLKFYILGDPILTSDGKIAHKMVRIRIIAVFSVEYKGWVSCNDFIMQYLLINTNLPLEII
jgi:hypothetical protein